MDRGLGYGVHLRQTPTNPKGLGAGHASDLYWVEACACIVAEATAGHTNVLENITMPLRTAYAIQTIHDADRRDDRS